MVNPTWAAIISTHIPALHHKILGAVPKPNKVIEGFLRIPVDVFGMSAVDWAVLG